MAPEITVILSTYNRAKDLARTLEGMAKAANRGLSVEFVVVDNGSSDQTKSAVLALHDRIAIRYIFEARSGKNRALNTALESCNLGEIVVFTDDDVDVPPDWLISIASVCDRWPNHAVFGGRIDVVFPIENIPKWASDEFIGNFAFSYHNYANKECIYKDKHTPFGPNFWVRREVFDRNRRYDQSIGPRPKNRIMGSETSFLQALIRDGYEIVYSPTVVVGHRIQSETLKFRNVCVRAYRLGRGDAHIYGVRDQTALTKYWPGLNKNYTMWLLYRSGSIIFSLLKVFLSILLSRKEKRHINIAKQIRCLGYRVESVRLIWSRE